MISHKHFVLFIFKDKKRLMKDPLVFLTVYAVLQAKRIESSKHSFSIIVSLNKEQTL